MTTFTKEVNEIYSNIWATIVLPMVYRFQKELNMSEKQSYKLVCQAVGFDGFNGFSRNWVKSKLVDNMVEQEIYEIANNRVMNSFVHYRNKKDKFSRKVEDLEFYRQVQKQLGNM